MLAELSELSGLRSLLSADQRGCCGIGPCLLFLPQVIDHFINLLLLNLHVPAEPLLVCRDPSLSALDIAFVSSRLSDTLSLPTCPPEIKSNIVRLVSSLVTWGEDEVAVLRGDGQLKTAIQQFDSQSDVALEVLAKL